MASRVSSQSDVLYGTKSSVLKLPFYQMSAVKKSLGMTNKCLQKSNQHSHNSSTFYGVENSIDIQLNQSNVRVYVMIFFLASWLPMLLILFLIYNTACLQMANQRSEVDFLKNQIQTLGAEVSFLKSQMTHLTLLTNNEEHQRLEDDEPRELPSATEDIPLSLITEFSNNNRKKRGATEDMQSDMQESRQPRRKVPISNSSRRGKHSNKKLRTGQAQRRHPFRRCFHCNHTKCSGLQAVQLKGAHPEKVAETGQVGPWFVDTKALKDSKISSTLQVKENGESIEIGDPGVYFIYAQLYYLTSQAFNSFSIMLVPKDSDSQVTLALCSGNAVSSNSTAEVSCFTGVMHTLQPGDLIFVQQREKHRILITKGGHSFFGIIKLGGH